MSWFERPEFGANVGLIDEIYRQYLDNPESVSPAWRDFFAENESRDDGAEETAEAGDTAEGRVEAEGGEPPRESAAPPTPQEAPPAKAPAKEPTAEKPAAKAEDKPKPAAKAEDKAGPKAKAKPEGDGKAEPELVPLRGAAARIVEAMEASREVPTATSVRTVPARLLEVNRSVLNGHLRRRQGGKVSFTHMIAYAVVKALEAVPVMTTMYREVDGKPNAARPPHVNLGLAVDTRRPDGSRTLLVPNIKQADTLDFAGFVRAYEELIGKVKANKLAVADFADTTLTITNPGTIGTVLSVPRLMAGQSAIIGVGAIDYPAEYQGADPDTLAGMGIGKVITLTSTYDHRVIQGAESGEFLARMHRLLLGEDDFYGELFRAMTVPYVPVQWHKDEKPGEDSLDNVEKQAGVLQLINLYRVRGHLIANLDPLKAKPPQMHPELDPASYGFTIWDLERRFVTGGLAGQRELPLGEILHILRDAYCRTGTVEYMHNAHTDEKQWIQEHVEGVPQELPKDDQLQILHKLNEAEAFERFLHNKYTGHKRFSLEGGESLIPMLDAVLDEAADAGMEGTVIGMSHRGRLNVLANTVGKSYGEIFGEFEGNLDPTLTQGSGDVKYHLGAVGKHVARSGKEVRVEVASNPSHLEAVNPVVEGIARAKQDLLDRGEEAPVLPILIHGDAAFAGQGVVAETLNLSQLRGYRTGGTVHIVVNNQVGFTTSPDYGRSSTYATDVAKMIQAPIFHVNGDDPEACVRVARLAFEFRQAFKKDVVIDMWCYRRYGHNEADEPSFTQPLMYERIKNRRPVRKLYTEALVNRGDLSIEDAEQSLEDFRQRLQQAFDDTHDEEDGQVAKVELERPAPMAADPAVDTTVDRDHPRPAPGQADDGPGRLRRPPQARQVAGAAGRGAGAQRRRLGPRRGPGPRVAAHRGPHHPAVRPGHPAGHLQPAPLGPGRPDHRRAVHPAGQPGRGPGQVLRLRQPAQRVRGHGLRVRLLGGQPRGAGAVGGPVRRLRQRRPDHRRPVHLGRRGQVGPALQPGPAAPPRVRGPGARALQRPPGALPRPRRRGQHAGRLPLHPGPVLPPAAPPGPAGQPQAADRDDPQVAAAAAGGPLHGRAAHHRPVPRGLPRPRPAVPRRGQPGAALRRQGLLRAGQAARRRGAGPGGHPPGRAAVPVPGRGAPGPARRLPQRRAHRLGPGGAGEHGRLALRAAQGRAGAGAAAGAGLPRRGRGPGGRQPDPAPAGAAGTTRPRVRRVKVGEPGSATKEVPP